VTIRLKYTKNLYWVKTSWEDRRKPQEAGFKWNKANHLFWTNDPVRARGFLEYAVDATTRQKLTADLAAIEQAMAQSRASNSDLAVPAPPGLSYLPFQVAGVEYAISRKAALIADEMGLGKTIQAIGVINTLLPRSVLVVCPASVKINWQREIEKWIVDWYPVGIAYGNQPFPTTSIVLINYDILNRFHDEIHGTHWDMIIGDECQYLKNPDAQRTQEVVGRWGNDPLPGIQADKKLFLTGTPILNRPKEIFTPAKYLDPVNFRSWWQFALRYCGAFSDGYGWNFDGATNLEELEYKLRTTIMIRRLKEQVQKELPAKIRQIIELPADGGRVRAERQRMRDYKQQVRALGLSIFSDLSEIAHIRHETALAKVPAVVSYLREILENGKKVVVFAWHRAVVDQIAEGIGRPISVVVTGATTPYNRQQRIDKFQTDPECRVFIGNFLAAGVGITLTAASTVVFAELDWVPGNITQAEDRCHRIGQKDTVHVQHLVLEGSIDAYMAKILVHKQEIIDRALDGKGVEEASRAEEILKDLFENY